MATQVQRWLSKDCKEFKTEAEADGHDRAQWLLAHHYKVQEASKAAPGVAYLVLQALCTDYEVTPKAKERPE